MSHFRLLALDIDGTLVNSRDELTAATAEAIRRACDSGIRVVLATGRRYSKTLHLVEPLRLDVPLVTASGALIKDPLDHRTLFRAEFKSGVLGGTLKKIASLGHDPILYGDTFADGFDYYCTRLTSEQPDLAHYFERNPSCGRLWPNLVANPPPGIFAGFTMSSRPEAERLKAELVNQFGNDLSLHVLKVRHYAGWFCEIAPGGVSKWSSIQQLAHHWGIADHEICAVGDDVNDIPMIEGAGLGVAMGNAVDQVRAAADRIAPCHDSDGLVAVVQWLLE